MAGYGHQCAPDEVGSDAAQARSRKVGIAFQEKIMLKQEARAG
jgi:hypothetical protein